MSNKMKSVCFLFLTAIIFLAAVGIYCFIREGREGSCRATIRGICLALDNYADFHSGYLPPSYICQEDGVPMHSWRALILRSGICYQRIYKEYRFDEAWDSPHNAQFAIDIKDYFSCDHTTNSGSSAFTNYVAVVGGDSFAPLLDPNFSRMPWSKLASTSLLFPHVGEKIILAELVDSTITWTEPQDVSLEKLITLIKADPSGIKLSEFVRRIVIADSLHEFHILDPIRDSDRISKAASRQDR